MGGSLHTTLGIWPDSKDDDGDRKSAPVSERAKPKPCKTILYVKCVKKFGRNLGQLGRPRPDGVQNEPMDARKASRKRRAEDTGHEADDAGRGGVQPDPGSMVDDSIPQLRREAEALGADAVALAGAYSSASWQRAGALGLSAGVAMDLRLGWDLGQRADQVKDEERLSDEKPLLLILSPMCLSLSRLQHAKTDELAELREEGKRNLEFACSLARLQIERGGRVLFEYPLAALEEPCLWKLRSIDGMRCVRCDQCQFGMTSVDSEGKV